MTRICRSMQKVIKKRGRLAPVRLEVQGGSKGDKLITFLCQRLNLPKDQVFVSKAPLRLDYVFDLPGLLPPESRAALCDTPYTPRYPTCLNPREPVTPQVLRHDVLLFYPYEQMEPFLQLIREAAFDPNVLSIRITIYRLATAMGPYLTGARETEQT